MPISSQHPTYKEQEDDWLTMRDALAGENAIRKSITRYLPPPPGMNMRGAADINDILGSATKGVQSRYAFYGTFAEWPEIVQMTLNAIQGLVHEKPPTVVLPKDMEGLLEVATPSGDTLMDLWETMTREMFSTGRVILLGEIVGDDILICPYTAESMINWHVLPKIVGGGPIMNVFKEVKSVPKADDPYEHEDVTTYRELQLEAILDEDGQPIGASQYRVRLWRQKANDSEAKRVVTSETDEYGWITPMHFGTAWDVIPVTVSNANDRTFKFGPIPLISAARRAISIFRKTADYFRSLYNKGDPQAVLFGVDKDDIPSSIGGSTVWAFPDADGSAMYLDIDGQGIPMQRTAIEDQYDRFEQETGRLIASDDQGSASNVSGETIRRKTANHQVNVKGLVINAAAAMESHLKLHAKLRGKSQGEIDAIEFNANLDFAEPMMTGREFMDYVLAKNAGGPLSTETLHDIARQHKITEKTFEEETAAIESEGPTQAEIDAELEAERLAEEKAAEDGEDDQDDDAGDDDEKDE
jgi:hypothetical protein